jgi:signal transduction histidine kinase
LLFIVSSRLATTVIDRVFTQVYDYAAEISLLNQNLEIKLTEQASLLLEQQAMFNVDMQRFADIGVLSAGMIHDINTPLSTVQANIEIIDDGQDKYLQRIKQSLTQINNIVDQTRAHIQGETEQSRFDPALVIEQYIAENLSPQFKVIVERDETILISGSSISFQRIMQNIITNACEAATLSDTKLIKIELSKHNQLVIRVSNCGQPMAPGVLGNMLRPGSTKSAHTGIGLIVTRKLLADYFQGQLAAITPVAGFDTTIEITIPLAER